MSQKNLAAILTLIAAVLGGPFAIDEATKIQEEVVASIEIVGPTEAEVGELVSLKINGERPSWLVPTQDHRVLGDQHEVLMSFRDAGTYKIVGNASAGGVASMKDHVIEVKEGQSVLVPKPVVPAVVPEVPDTVPVPTPDPLVDKGRELENKVYAWCVEYQPPMDKIGEIGNSFIHVASTAKDIDGLLKQVAQKNRQLDQKGCERVLASVQQYLFTNLQGQDFEAHRCAFDEIGVGMKRYADKVKTRTEWK